MQDDDSVKDIQRSAVRPALNIVPTVSAEDVGLRDIFAVVRRRVGILLGVVVGAVLLAATYVFLQTPLYTAQALIMVQPDTSGDFASFSSVVEGLPGDRESVRSEAMVLSSRGLAGDVVDRLDLGSDPEFAEEDQNGSSGVRSAIVTRFVHRLDVEPVPNSRVITVRFTSADAEKAANITNTLLQEYQASRVALKADVTREASAWMDDRIEELRADIAEKEAVLEDLREQFDLVDGDGVSLASRELLELNRQLVMARTQQAELEARLRQVEELQELARQQALGGSSGQQAAEDGSFAGDPLDASFEVLQSPLIQRLREQEAQVQRRVAELSSELGEMHPRMVQLKAEARDIRDRIDSEVDKIVAGLRSEVEIAGTRVLSLSRSLENLKQTVQDGNRNAIRVRAVEREAEASRQLLATLLSRDKQIMSESDQGFQRSDSTVISWADVPAEPSYPRAEILLGLAFVGAILVGLVVVFVIELLDDGFRSGEQIEQVTGVPGLGFIPLVRKVSSTESMLDLAMREPGSALSESIRTLSWTLKIMHPDDPPRSVLVTSSVADEGKTTLATLLAFVEGQADRKVLLIDADVRKPGCHSLTSVDRKPGLTDYLAGELDLDELLSRDSVDPGWPHNVSVIPAGSETTAAANLLGSEKMGDLLARVSDQFDLIVIDSPPVTVAADAQLLSRVADTTILAVAWGSTRKKTAAFALKRLHEAGASISGATLTMVDMRKSSSYSYGDSAAYGREFDKYFAG
jgi:capsular exopolysaccharide synthesis family protein